MVECKTFKLRVSHDSTLLRSLILFSISSTLKLGIALLNPGTPPDISGINGEFCPGVCPHMVFNISKL